MKCHYFLGNELCSVWMFVCCILYCHRSWALAESLCWLIEQLLLISLLCDAPNPQTSHLFCSAQNRTGSWKGFAATFLGISPFGKFLINSWASSNFGVDWVASQTVKIWQGARAGQAVESFIAHLQWQYWYNCNGKYLGVQYCHAFKWQDIGFGLVIGSVGLL
jgi:hypothetical protein